MARKLNKEEYHAYFEHTKDDGEKICIFFDVDDLRNGYKKLNKKIKRKKILDIKFGFNDGEEIIIKILKKDLKSLLKTFK